MIWRHCNNALLMTSHAHLLCCQHALPTTLCCGYTWAWLRGGEEEEEETKQEVPTWGHCTNWQVVMLYILSQDSDSKCAP